MKSPKIKERDTDLLAVASVLNSNKFVVVVEPSIVGGIIAAAICAAAKLRNKTVRVLALDAKNPMVTLSKLNLKADLKGPAIVVGWDQMAAESAMPFLLKMIQLNIPPRAFVNIGSVNDVRVFGEFLLAGLKGGEHAETTKILHQLVIDAGRAAAEADNSLSEQVMLPRYLAFHAFSALYSGGFFLPSFSRAAHCVSNGNNPAQELGENTVATALLFQNSHIEDQVLLRGSSIFMEQITDHLRQPAANWQDIASALNDGPFLAMISERIGVPSETSTETPRWYVSPGKLVVQPGLQVTVRQSFDARQQAAVRSWLRKMGTIREVTNFTTILVPFDYPQAENAISADALKDAAGIGD